MEIQRTKERQDKTGSKDPAIPQTCTVKRNKRKREGKMGWLSRGEEKESNTQKEGGEREKKSQTT
jgi:hypothetical protein